MKRCLILDLETSALTPEFGDIVRFRAESFSDPEDDFDEWVKPPRPLSADAEHVIGTTNERLAHCRPMNVALADFLEFIDGAELVGDRLDLDLAFLKVAIKKKGIMNNKILETNSHTESLQLHSHFIFGI